jgi:hypothetical protein
MTYRPDLKMIEQSYLEVQARWQEIDDLLYQNNIGRKDTPFDEGIMQNMLLAWEYLDYFIRTKTYGLLSPTGGADMLEINNLIHYGDDYVLRQEYQKAIDANTEKFSVQIKPIREYYKTKPHKNYDSANKVSAEIYISILGMPQLFIEGNHRSGSIIASWINLIHDGPPFVLTAENAISYFSPTANIKKFNKRSVWRSMTKLPKYKKSFKTFWESHCDMKFVRRLKT